MNVLALFSGAGGGILGEKLLGWRTICACEINPYAAGVLAARQNDGCLQTFPIWDDIATFDGKPWRGLIDVVSGGFPCQDISSSGKKVGITGKRSGLWKPMLRVIGEVGPRYILLENSPLLVGRGLVTVLADLAQMGYDARWGVVGAHHAGAPQLRDRIWIVGERTVLADSGGKRGQLPVGRELATIEESRRYDAQGGFGGGSGEWWATEPGVGRVATRVESRVDRLRCTGNGQVPAVVRLVWDLLGEPGTISRLAS